MFICLKVAYRSIFLAEEEKKVTKQHVTYSLY
jgi:hypothetical protein